MKSSAKIFAAATVALCLSNAPAFAQVALMKECGAEWQAHKTNKAVIPGETWNQFLSECRVRKAANTNAPAAAPISTPAPMAPAPMAPAPMAPAPMSAPAPKTVIPAPASVAIAPRPETVTPTYPPAMSVEPAAQGKRTSTAGQQAFYARERACGKEWKQRRLNNQIAVGETWPKYLKECNTKLKAAGQ